MLYSNLLFPLGLISQPPPVFQRQLLHLMEGEKISHPHDVTTNTSRKNKIKRGLRLLGLSLARVIIVPTVGGPLLCCSWYIQLDPWNKAIN